MTPATAQALEGSLSAIYQRFGGYHDRLSKQQRAPEDRAIFEQLFSRDLRETRGDVLVPLVKLLKLPEHRFGALELKYLLPRLCEVTLDERPAVGFPELAELLGLFQFERWPQSERELVWDFLLLFFRGLLEEFSGRKAPPWGAYGYFRDLTRATQEIHPALVSWETADFVTASLHLATFAVAWVEDRAVRDLQPWGREPTNAIQQWLGTAGRAKLIQAATTHAAEPFAFEFGAALDALARL